MKTILSGTLSVALVCLTYINLYGQEVSSNSVISNKEIKAVNMVNFLAFKKSIAPLIEEMATKKIVGLGEGTHGTAEFYKLRFWISRILIEEKGFRNISFENDLADVWLLNQQLSRNTDITMLMKAHLMSIWQNEETKEFLTWIKTYNDKHTDKVIVSGLDYTILKPDIEMLFSLLEKSNNNSMKNAVIAMEKAALLQDKAWIGKNDRSFKADMKSVAAGSKRAFLIADSMEKQLAFMEFPLKVKADLKLALANIKQGFEPFSRAVSSGDRDSIMAYNASLLLKRRTDKMVIWAHNAHIGKTRIYNGVIGDMGGYLLKLYPNNYLAIGTGTTNGTFAGTTDIRLTNSNIMNSYQLKKPIKDSWEEILSEKGENFYFNTSKLNPSKLIKTLRFIGYGIESDDSTSEKTNLVDLFDTFLFIKESKAPTPLQ